MPAQVGIQPLRIVGATEVATRRFVFGGLEPALRSPSYEFPLPLRIAQGEAGRGCFLRDTPDRTDNRIA